jgi:hypothetical protein
MWTFGDDLEKVCRIPEQHNDWFSRETAFVQEIGKVVTITGGWQNQLTTEPRNELFGRGGVTVSRYVARQGASRLVGVSIATKTT